MTHDTDRMEILNVPLVGKTIRDKGIRSIWLIGQMGMGRGAGYTLLRNGTLPKDPEVRDRALAKLSEILGLEPSSLVIQVGDKVAAKTA
jgi:hypothetical protein